MMSRSKMCPRTSCTWSPSELSGPMFRGTRFSSQMPVWFGRAPGEKLLLLGLAGRFEHCTCGEVGTGDMLGGQSYDLLFICVCVIVMFVYVVSFVA